MGVGGTLFLSYFTINGQIECSNYVGTGGTLTQGRRNGGSKGSIVLCDTLTEPAENWKIQGGGYSSVLGIICRLGLTDLLTFAPLDPLLPPYLQP